MERSHSGYRGQCSLEMAVALLALTAIVVVLKNFAIEARDYVRPAWLSREVRR